MEFKELIDNLESSPQFKSWQQEHPDSFLAHVFVMSEDPTKEGYQIGYYDEQKDKITSFLIHGNKIEQLPPSEILKDAEHKIQPLHLDQVKFSQEEASKIAKGCRESEYQKHPIMKVFFILQTIDNAPIFNITFFTQDFKTINIKIDANSGKIIKHSLANLASFDKP